MVAKLWNVNNRLIGWKGFLSLWGSCRIQTMANLTPPKDKANFDRNLVKGENKDEDLCLTTIAQESRKPVLQN